MIEALMLVAANAFIGAVIIWAIINESPYSPQGGKGWFAIRTGPPDNPKNEPAPVPAPNKKRNILNRPRPPVRSPR